MNSKFAKAFVIGSSLPVTIWTLCLAGIANSKKVLHYELFSVALPAIFGFINGLMVLFPGTHTQTRMAFVGAIFGLLSAAHGSHFTDTHCKLFNLPERYKFMLFFLEPLFFAFIWGVIIYSLNESFGLY